MLNIPSIATLGLLYLSFTVEASCFKRALQGQGGATSARAAAEGRGLGITPLPETRVYYRWQSEDAAEAMLRVGSETPIPASQFGSKEGFAGRGLYVSSSPSTSQSYGARLVEVHVPAGAPSVSTHHPTHLGNITRGIWDADALRLLYDAGEEPLVMRFNTTWSVVKGGQPVTFRPLSARSMMGILSQEQVTDKVLSQVRTLTPSEMENLFQALRQVGLPSGTSQEMSAFFGTSAGMRWLRRLNHSARERARLAALVE